MCSGVILKNICEGLWLLDYLEVILGFVDIGIIYFLACTRESVVISICVELGTAGTCFF